MKLSAEEVKKIALLARIELKDEEIEKYRDQLSDILEYVNKLQEVDTSNVGEKLNADALQSIGREDEIINAEAEELEKIFDNMPDKENNQLKTIGIFKK